jgi:hypothetical protein
MRSRRPVERHACYRVEHHLGEHEEGSSKITTTPRTIHSKRKVLAVLTLLFPKAHSYNWRIVHLTKDNELERMWEEADTSRVPTRNLPEVTEENHTYIYQGSLRPREGRSRYLRDTNQKCDWAKLFDTFLPKGMRLRCLTVGFLPMRPRFSTRVVSVGCVVEKRHKNTFPLRV